MGYKFLWSNPISFMLILNVIAWFGAVYVISFVLSAVLGSLFKLPY